MAPTSSAICVVAGVGPGTGASVARKFAKQYVWFSYSPHLHILPTPPFVLSSLLLLVRHCPSHPNLLGEANIASSYPVVLLARNPANFEPLVAEIEKSGGKAVGITADVTSAKSMDSAFTQIKALGDLGGEEVKVAAAVFNVAGGFVRKPFLETSLQEWEAGYETNR